MKRKSSPETIFLKKKRFELKLNFNFFNCNLAHHGRSVQLDYEKQNYSKVVRFMSVPPVLLVFRELGRNQPFRIF